MTQDVGIVAEALDQCTEDFKRGLNSHGSPTVRVPDEIVAGLRERLSQYFHKNLVTDERTWHGSDGDSGRVTRMAFYLGAVAAFRAYADDPVHGPEPEVAQKHVDAAFSYVREHCAGPAESRPANDIRWIYCDW